MERYSFALVCSYLPLQQLVMLQVVSRALQPKALDIESWRSRLADREQVERLQRCKAGKLA